MSGFKDFWSSTKSDPTTPLLLASEAQVRSNVSCPRCAVCLDFFLSNLSLIDKKGKTEDVIRVFRKGGHYSIKEGEMFALLHRPPAVSPPSTALSAPASSNAVPATSPSPSSVDAEAIIQVCPPILFSADDLQRLEREGTLGPVWESGPPSLDVVAAAAQAAFSAAGGGGGGGGSSSSKKSK